MSDFDDGEEQSFFKKNRVLIVVTGLILCAASFGVWKLSKSATAAPPKQERIAMVSLPPPPVRPPPPPPPPPPQKIEPKERMEQPTPDKPEPPETPDEPPTMGSGIKGDGNDPFGLSGSGNGGRVGFGGKGNGGASAYARYASQIQGRLAEALRQDKRTRASAFDLRLKLWIDASGIVTRAEPAGGNSNPAAASTLLGIRFSERPPDGMPMPLIARISARRPN